MTNPTTEFVQAADRLINLLNGPIPTGRITARNHQRGIDKAFDAYDRARANLTGEHPGEDADDGNEPKTVQMDQATITIGQHTYRATNVILTMTDKPIERS